MASGRSSGPRAGAQNLQPVYFRESHEFLLERSGRALTLSRFVGRTGRPGPKSGDDWFFMKRESSPDLGPEPQAQIRLDKGVPQIIGPTCLSCLLNASARVGYAVLLFARALLFSLLDLRTGIPGLFHVFLVVLAILRRYRTAQHAMLRSNVSSSVPPVAPMRLHIVGRFSVQESPCTDNRLAISAHSCPQIAVHF